MESYSSFSFFPKPQSIFYPSSPLKCLGSLWIHQDAIFFSFVEMFCLTFFVAPNNKIWCFLSVQATVSNIIWTPSQINEALPYICISIQCKNTYSWNSNNNLLLIHSLWARNLGYAHLGNTFSPFMLAQVTGLDSSKVSCTGRKGKCVFLLIISASPLIIQWPNLDLSIAQSLTP